MEGTICEKNHVYRDTLKRRGPSIFWTEAEENVACKNLAGLDCYISGDDDDEFQCQHPDDIKNNIGPLPQLWSYFHPLLWFYPGPLKKMNHQLSLRERELKKR